MIAANLLNKKVEEFVFVIKSFFSLKLDLSLTNGEANIYFLKTLTSPSFSFLLKNSKVCPYQYFSDVVYLFNMKKMLAHTVNDE